MKENIKEISCRFGGYWRFPELLDFCYLVNPYFPKETMIDEFKNNFEFLLRDYPSGLNVQNSLAADFFNIDSSNILVGNGAAELIKALFEVVEGSMGIIYPTFNEYPERISEERIVKIFSSGSEFSYTIDLLKSYRDKVDNLLLINPDNPTGHFFSKKEIIDLVSFYSEKGKNVILDESFVDFSSEGPENTLIHNEIIQKYNNLIIIKSISKSYGVPGLRLGVLVTKSQNTLSKVRKGLSIWNINSFAENFFQIYPKYHQDYIFACTQIAEERDRFFNELKKINFLRPISSQANYIMCEVTQNLSSGELTALLLTKYNIYIKDLKGKVCFENNNFIRIAVRDKKDDDYLLNVLTEISI